MSFLKSVSRPALAAVAALMLAAAAPAPVRAEPAMWVIRDEDSTIYLLGTIHLLKPDLVWRTTKVDKAIRDAGDLTIEIVGADDPAVALPLIQRLGLDPSRSLSSKLRPAYRRKLAESAKAAGLPDGAIEGFQPWFAAISLAIAPMLKAGFDPNAGVDKLVQAAAKADGDQIQAFETLEQQLRFFADLPEATQVEFLEQSLDDYDKAETQLGQMIGSWAAGDVAALEKLMIDDMRQDSPHLYRLLITDRNADWAAKIEQKLKTTRGTSLIAVGAGHLVGPDSVQAQLKKRGVQAERY